jgi:hypothetical protein
MSVPADDLKNLLYLLTFVTPNGDCLPSVVELASAMQVSETKVRQRMARLTRFCFGGEPAVVAVQRGSGLDAFAPSPSLYDLHVQSPNHQPARPPMPPTAGREAVIEHTRSTYAKPREEVERTIAELNGWEVPEQFVTPEEQARANVRRRLLAFGVSKEEADALLARFALERIERQIEWMAYRDAKRPARYLVAAIEEDYGMPTALQVLRAQPLPKGESQPQPPDESDSEPRGLTDGNAN